MLGGDRLACWNLVVMPRLPTNDMAMEERVIVVRMHVRERQQAGQRNHKGGCDRERAGGPDRRHDATSMWARTRESQTKRTCGYPSDTIATGKEQPHV